MALPRVTSEYVVDAPLKLIFEQLADVFLVHDVPVYPFAQMQLHELPLRILVPPFSQAASLWQICKAERVLVSLAGLLRTKNSKGTTTAAAITTRINKMNMIKHHRGIPQHLRPFLHL